MSITESMKEVGRPIAYYPRLAKFFGSVNAAIFFSQLFYWQDRADSELGVFKTSEEWTEETGLSYREQVTARKHLVELGLLVETHKRLEHRIYFKLNLAAIDAAFGQWTEAQSPNCEKRNPPSDENAIRGVRQTQVVNKTEITTETTSEITARAQAPDVSDVPPEVLADYQALRKAKRAPLTKTAVDGLRSEGAKAGMSLAQVMALCCERGWTGFQAGWVLGRGEAPGGNAGDRVLNRQEALEARNRAVGAQWAREMLGNANVMGG